MVVGLMHTLLYQKADVMRPVDLALAAAAAAALMWISTEHLQSFNNMASRDLKLFTAADTISRQGSQPCQQMLHAQKEQGVRDEI